MKTLLTAIFIVLNVFAWGQKVELLIPPSKCTRYSKNITSDSMFYTYEKNRIFEWDLKKDSLTRTFDISVYYKKPTCNQVINDLNFASDSKYGSIKFCDSSTLCVINKKNFSLNKKLTYPFKILEYRFSEDYKYIFLTSTDTITHIYDYSSNKFLYNLKGSCLQQNDVGNKHYIIVGKCKDRYSDNWENPSNKEFWNIDSMKLITKFKPYDFQFNTYYQTLVLFSQYTYEEGNYLYKLDLNDSVPQWKIIKFKDLSSPYNWDNYKYKSISYQKPSDSYVMIGYNEYYDIKEERIICRDDNVLEIFRKELKSKIPNLINKPNKQELYKFIDSLETLSSIIKPLLPTESWVIDRKLHLFDSTFLIFDGEDISNDTTKNYNTTLYNFNGNKILQLPNNKCLEYLSKQNINKKYFYVINKEGKTLDFYYTSNGKLITSIFLDTPNINSLYYYNYYNDLTVYYSTINENRFYITIDNYKLICFDISKNKIEFSFDIQNGEYEGKSEFDLNILLTFQEEKLYKLLCDYQSQSVIKLSIYNLKKLYEDTYHIKSYLGGGGRNYLMIQNSGHLIFVAGDYSLVCWDITKGKNWNFEMDINNCGSGYDGSVISYFLSSDNLLNRSTGSSMGQSHSQYNIYDSFRVVNYTSSYHGEWHPPEENPLIICDTIFSIKNNFVIKKYSLLDTTKKVKDYDYYNEELYLYKQNKIDSIKFSKDMAYKDCNNIGRYLIFEINHEYKVFDVKSEKFILSSKYEINFLREDIYYYEKNDKLFLKKLNDSIFSFAIDISNYTWYRFLDTSINTIKIFTLSKSNRLRIYNFNTKNLEKEYQIQKDKLVDNMCPKRNFFVTSYSNQISFHQLSTGKPLYTYIPIDKDNFIVYDEDGHYDASEDALQYIYYSCGNKVVPASKTNYKSRVKGLVQKIMSNNQQQITAPTKEDLNICNLVE